MRILILNQCFYPDVVATAQHGWDLARDLVAAGHEVTAISSRSMYGSKGAALPSHEVVDGVRIERVGSSYFGKGSLVARTIDFVRFAATAFLRSMTIGRQDVAICLTTPPFIGTVGWVLRCLRGTKFVYWAMDLYPDLPIACGVMSARSPFARLLESVNRFCLRRADKVVVIGRCMRDRVIAKGVDPSRIELIHVWSDADEVVPLPLRDTGLRRSWTADDRTVVMYSGNFGIGHDVETIAGAVSALRDDPRILFVFSGGGERKAELLGRLQAEGLGNFVDVAYQPRERLAELLGSADVHLASLRDGVEGIMVPSKVYGVMAAARPLVVIAPMESEISRAVAESGCGTVVRCGDTDALAEAIRGYASDGSRVEADGAKGRAALERRWGASHALAGWRRLLESLGASR